MADAKKRIILYQEKTTVDNSDYVLTDSSANGTKKYQVTRILTEAEATAQAKVDAEAAAREAADNELKADLDYRTNVDLTTFASWTYGTITAEGEPAGEEYRNRLRSEPIDMTLYTTANFSVTSGYKYKAFVYDSNGTFIKALFDNLWTTTDNTYTFSDEEKYLRLLLSNTSDDTIQMNEVTSLTVSADFRVGQELIASDLNHLTKLTLNGVAFEWEVGTLIAGIGTESDGNTRIRSKFIPVVEGTTFTLSGNADCLIVYLYTKDKTFISDSPWTAENSFLVTDSSARYARILIRKDSTNPVIYNADIQTQATRLEFYGPAIGAINGLIGANCGDPLFNTIYHTPIQNLVEKYNATVSAGNVGYIWISDLHINSLYPDRNSALKRQLMACADIANRTNIQFICIGGDIIDRETSYNAIYSIFNEAFVGVKGSRKPIVVLTGNHDDNPYTNDVPLTKAQVKGLFVDMSDIDVIDEDFSKCYYYFDKKGYRFVCLDMIDYPDGYAGDSWWGYSQAQVEWVANLLKENDKPIIILSHQTLDYSHNAWGLGNGGGYTEDLKNLLDAYNARTTISLYGVQYDYSKATNKVLYTHAGHFHADEMYTEESRTVPTLITQAAKNEATAYGTKIDDTTYIASNADGGHFNSEGWTFKFYGDRTLGTINEAAFDVVSVGKSMVNVFRVGAGEDRSFAINR